MVIFKVDDVTPAATALPTRPVRELFADSLVVGGNPELTLLVPDGVQPLLSAVGRAFAEHRPLVLSPEAIWLTITQGLAQHVRLHAEELRPQLVVHAGRKRLTVPVDGPMPHDPATWQAAVASFAGLLGDEIGHPDLFDCDFSTSTDVDRVAGQIVMLDAYSPYFALWLMFVCARLYPYVRGDGAYDRPNPLLDLPIREPRNVTVTRATSDSLGIRTDQVPATLSRVILNINDRITGDNRAVALHGGLIGVAQDDDGALRPVAGWHLTPATIEIDDVIDRIEREHVVAPPETPSFFGGSADLVALYRRLGSATLFDGAWRLLPESEHRRVWRSSHQHSLVTVIDLADGRSIAAASDDATETTHWVTCRIGRPDNDEGHRLLDEAVDVPVYGTSLAMLLEAAMDSGGDISHLVTGNLHRLEAACTPS